MDKLIKNYIQDIADFRGVELTNEQLQDITDRVNESSIWDTIDYFINSLIDEMEE